MSTMKTSSPPKVIGTKHPDTTYRDRVALPGGGIEPNEDHFEAAHRELLEETGATITMRSGEYFAATEEYRHDLHQVSFCYCADLLEDTGKPQLTEEELADGLSHSWMPFEQALKVMTAAEPTSVLGKSIRERDIYFLKEARTVLNVS
ncbi:hypothetical protein Golomagni_07367 [Golovinomyces magnicellulatus]|nr:hypothetical protein Golomagni_07367 [Golovinomyces magnicellulatus]